MEWIDVTTVSGNIIILPGHAPMIEQLLSKRTISMKLPGGALKTIMLENGILSVTREAVVIVLTL